jgi:hypothetical protein
MNDVSHISEVMADLVRTWGATAVKEAKAAHPNLADMFGRTWVWIGGDLYRHDSMTWTKGMVESPHLRGPSQDALTNPNYTWCEQCKAIAS